MDKTKSELAARLNRIEGQIRGIKAMIGKDAACDDVLNQIAAIQSALNGVGKLLFKAHLRDYVVSRIQAGEQEVMEELLRSVSKLMK